jgi:hypothetical protein
LNRPIFKYGVPLLVVLTAIGLAIQNSQPAWQVYRNESEKATLSRSIMRVEQEKNIATLQLEARYDSELGREEKARERGWLAPGEVALTLP